VTAPRVVARLACSLVLGACGGNGAAAPAPATPASAGTASRVPATTLDPPPPRGPVKAAASTRDGAVALRVGGATARAIDVALATLGAMLHGDRAALERLLAPTVTRVRPRFGPRMERDRLVEGLVTWSLRARAGGGVPDDIESLIDVSAIEVQRVDERFPDRPAGGDIRPDDYAVTLPLRQDLGGGRGLLEIPGWARSPVLVVRVGRSPVVLGF